MQFLPVPKLLQWQPSVPQVYKTKRKILLTSGCSFTSSTLQLKFCATWPGFVLDRCGFDHAVDYSFPGAGNTYIGDSIRHHLCGLTDAEVQDITVVVMWSGIDRLEQILPDVGLLPMLGPNTYQRITYKATAETRLQSARASVQHITGLAQYLESRGIPFVFTMYANLFHPPYLPKRDSTHHFTDVLSESELQGIRILDWVPESGMDFMFEYAFKHDMLSDDLFHPNDKCSERWTDDILLPGMLRQGLIQKI
jgi:hypothetical protein